MKVYKYKNYMEYVKCQITAFQKKINNQWAVEENIKFLSDWLIENNKKIETGLCHGVRQAKEIIWFEKYLPGCKVIGSEIGEKTHEKVVQWDFNKENSDWIGKFDFIYSNSFDHAFNPIATLNIWSKQLKPGGVLMLEYDKRQEHTGEISMKVNRTDPVSITVEEMIENIVKWVDGSEIVIILDMPKIKKVFQKTIIVKIK